MCIQRRKSRYRETKNRDNLKRRNITRQKIDNLNRMCITRDKITIPELQEIKIETQMVRYKLETTSHGNKEIKNERKRTGNS